MQQEREAAGPLHERADGGALEAENEIALPMPRHRAILHLGRTLADQNLGGDEVLAGAPGPGARHAERPPRAQARGEFSAQRPSAVNDRLIFPTFDRLKFPTG